MIILRRLLGSLVVLAMVLALLAAILYLKSGGLPTPLNIPPGVDLAATPLTETIQCERMTIPVELGPRGLLRYDVVGELCAPGSPDGRLLQVLVSGSGYGMLYWDFPYQPDRYSYARAAWRAGYATFNYYRPGLGESDHPFGALLTVDRHAYVLAQLLDDLDQRHEFAGIVTVGHSFGSVTAIAHALTRSDQVDGIILTGFAHNTNPGFIMAMRDGVDFAAFKGPFAGKIIDPTYLVSKPGMRAEIFYTLENTDPAVVAVDEANRQPTTLGETISASKYFGTQSRDLQVPVLLLLGDDDFVVCGGELDCKNHAATVAHEQAYFGAASCLEMQMLPDTGHNSALHLDASATFALMLNWVGRRVGGGDGRPAAKPCGEPRAAAVTSGLDVLVFGGTGRLGAAIVRRLVSAGHHVAVFVRPQSRRERLAGLDVDYLPGDLVDAGSVMAALAGRRFDVAIDATSRDRERARFYAEAMRNMLAVLAEAGLRQFILHGSVGAGDNRKNFPNLRFENMLTVMEDKGEAERLLKGSGIPYTIIRNGRVLADGTPASGHARLVEDETLFGTVSREDLAELTMRCVGQAGCIGRVFHAVGNGRSDAL